MALAGASLWRVNAAYLRSASSARRAERGPRVQGEWRMEGEIASRARGAAPRLVRTLGSKVQRRESPTCSASSYFLSSVFSLSLTPSPPPYPPSPLLYLCACWRSRWFASKFEHFKKKNKNVSVCNYDNVRPLVFFFFLLGGQRSNAAREDPTL